MKKNFKFYIIGWAALLGLFNLLTFIIPAWPTLEKFSASFWIGWGAALSAFVGQFFCSLIAFKQRSADKTFLNISLFTVSYSGLISMFVVSMIFIIATPVPYWIAAIVCYLVLLINLIAIMKAKIAINAVTNVETKVENATAFISYMRMESDSLFARAKSEDAVAVCKKVCDAFRFSDPMSNAILYPVECEIKTHFDIFKGAVLEGNDSAMASESEEILALISERNNKCKFTK